MGVAAPQAPFGGWGPGPLKSSVTGPSLLVNCYLEIKFHKKIPIGPPLRMVLSCNINNFVTPRLPFLYLITDGLESY